MARICHGNEGLARLFVLGGPRAKPIWNAVFLHIHAGQLAMNIVVTYSAFDYDDDAASSSIQFK